MNEISGAIGVSHWPLVSAATMRALDEATIKDLGIPGDVLMESAGRELAAMIARETTGRVAFLCGPGNNGGDGLVAARHLYQHGRDVDVALITGGAGLSADAARNLERYQGLGRGVLRSAPGEIRASVVVDALFGTGLRRLVEGDFAQAIGAAQRSGGHLIAVDLPSGLDADTGQVLGVALRADRTLTIGLPKFALALEPGRSYAGQVSVARIGIRDATEMDTPEGIVLRAPGIAALLPRRDRAGHKGRFGHVLVAAGAPGTTGAAALAAEGALRVGAGLVTVGCPAGVEPILETLCTEAMTVALYEAEEGGGIGLEALDALLTLAEERDVVCVGPGVGRDAETSEAVLRFVGDCDRPLVLDADGLYPFSRALGTLRSRRAPTVLTPHPGEAARLLDTDAASINADRVAAAMALAGDTESVVVLKGAGTVVAAPGQLLAVNPTGGPILATGGTGDVLAGVCAGLLAQGLDAHHAAVVAAWLHGAAGDRLAEREGRAGVLAREIAREIPRCQEELRSAEAPVETGFALPFP